MASQHTFRRHEGANERLAVMHVYIFQQIFPAALTKELPHPVRLGEAGGFCTQQRRPALDPTLAGERLPPASSAPTLPFSRASPPSAWGPVAAPDCRHLLVLLVLLLPASAGSASVVAVWRVTHSELVCLACCTAVGLEILLQLTTSVCMGGNLTTGACMGGNLTRGNL
jgi:hypothetical protein